VECRRGHHRLARRITRPGPPRGRAQRRADRGGDRLTVGAGRCDRATGQPGWDNAKKVNGRKRHIAVDATGLLLEVLVTPASTQDRDAARPLLFNLHRAHRRIRLAWADGGYAGKLQPWAATYLKLTVQIVRRPDDLHTFQVLPRRWVVERTLAWITSYRRCARDYERLPAHHEATVYWAMITLMTRRLARPG
jgi:transposase